MADSYEIGTGPGFTKPTHEYGTAVGSAGYQDQFLTEVVQELLASTVAYRQRGVTLAGGQGVLPTGTVIAQNTANGKYYIHDSAARNGAGTNVAIGILRDARDTGSGSAGPTSNPNPVSPSGKVATDTQGNLVYSGALNASLISGTDTASLVTGFGGGIGSGTNGAYTSLLSKGRLQGGNATAANPAFPGSPMDSSEGNIFIF
jgi:hypothetical protein